MKSFACGSMAGSAAVQGETSRGSAPVLSSLCLAVALSGLWALSERSGMSFAARTPELLLGAIVCLSIAGVSSLFLPRGRVGSLLRLGGVLLAFSLLYDAVGALQLALVPMWFDPYLIALDTMLWGGEFSVLLIPFRHPVLTEFLMFSYVIYVPSLFLVGLLCSRQGPEAVDTYTDLLVRTYIICYAGFLLFPVASQGFHPGAQFAGPLTGGAFTQMAEAIRTDIHVPGGSLPSAHCAAATVMLAALWRSWRASFWVLLPVLAPIYAATIYGQFHYVWDSLAGIGVALGVITYTRRFSPSSPQRRQP